MSWGGLGGAALHLASFLLLYAGFEGTWAIPSRFLKYNPQMRLNLSLLKWALLDSYHITWGCRQDGCKNLEFWPS